MYLKIVRTLLAIGAISACSPPPMTQAVAPGAPGAPPTWSNAQKIGIGTAYEAYDAQGQYSDTGPTGAISKVWFSLGRDRITEVMWGLIHETQIREIRFVVVGPEGVIQPDSVLYDLHRPSQTAPPDAPMTGVVAVKHDDVYALQWSTFTDPDRDSLLVKLDFVTARQDLKVFVLIDPALANTGSGDLARITKAGIHAWQDDAHLFAQFRAGTDALRSTGFVGVSDGLADLEDGALDDIYHSTGELPGNVAAIMEVPFSHNQMTGPEATLVIGFGRTQAQAMDNAEATSAAEPLDVYSKYVDQWATYLAALEYLPILAEASLDGGHLAYMSVLNLKVMEDKTHAGALIASLSNPWGETTPATTPQTGYKAVWPRDFFQVASAFLAVGDTETALAAYRYLPTVQVSDKTPGNRGVTGWFLQKTHVDGALEWVAVQQDQTAMPIMLGYKLWQAGVIDDAEMAQSYSAMLKPAADFLVDGGRVELLWNNAFEARLGYTQHERWEEQTGYSPSTVAAVISGLIVAGELAGRFGDPADAARYTAAADALEAQVEALMFTTTGALGDGQYFIRISADKDPNGKTALSENNGRPGLPEDMIIDGGFLELVRYGVRGADAVSVLASLPELDGERADDLRLHYVFGDGVEGWRRYGNDGYGEDGAGTNYHQIDGGNTPGQRGRVWPMFTGERGHYELQVLGDLAAKFGLRHPDVQAQQAIVRRAIEGMEAFANQGLSLPEQVWDGVGDNPFGYDIGEGTNSATPLAWTHAEYLKLLRSISDGAVWDRYDVVAQRYADAEPGLLPE